MEDRDSYKALGNLFWKDRDSYKALGNLLWKTEIVTQL